MTIAQKITGNQLLGRVLDASDEEFSRKWLNEHVKVATLAGAIAIVGMKMLLHPRLPNAHTDSAFLSLIGCLITLIGVVIGALNAVNSFTVLRGESLGLVSTLLALGAVVVEVAAVLGVGLWTPLP
jgi:hypothetical protein